MQKRRKNKSKNKRKKNHSQHFDEDGDGISSQEKKFRENRVFTSKAPIKVQIERAFKNGCKEIKICIKGSNGEPLPSDYQRLRDEWKNIFSEGDCYQITRGRNFLAMIKCVEAAVKLLNKKRLVDTPIEKVLIESSFTSEYVIKGLDTGISCEEIERLLSLQDIYVHKIVRFTEKEKDVLSTTVLIKELGDVERKEVKLGSVTYDVRKFFEKPKVCSKCLKVGHYQTKCTDKESKCQKCGGDHEATSCSKFDLQCFRCGSIDHMALDKRCPVVKEEHDILTRANKEDMSLERAKSEIEEEKKALKAEIANVDLEQLGLKGLANALEELKEAVNNLANVTLELLDNQTTVGEVEKRDTSEQSQTTPRSI